MSVAVWPPGLPQEPLAPGFKRRPDPKARIATSMEAGPAKVRRRSALRTKPLDLVYPIPRADFPTFVAFYEDTLKDGTLPFEWPDPIEGVTKRVRFRPDESDAYEAPLETGGRFYLVTIKIEELP